MEMQETEGWKRKEMRKKRPRGKRKLRGDEEERLGSAVREDEVGASVATNEGSDVGLGMGRAVSVEEWSICRSACWDITITFRPPNSHLYNH